MRFYFFFTLFLGIVLQSNGQIYGPQEWDAAALEAKAMKNGVLILRLETNDKKIIMLKRSLQNSKMKERKRRRTQKLLDETILRKDVINKTLVHTFLDTFSYCPVYVSYDTSINSIKKGIRKGIYVNRNLEIDPSIELPEREAIYLVSFRERSASHPQNGIEVRKIGESLHEPFPTYIDIRQSFVNDINTPRIRRAIPQLQNRLQSLLEKAEKKSGE